MATRWQPDTCDCVIEYDELDANGDPIVTKHTLCARHASASPKETLADNREINKLVGELNAQYSRTSDSGFMKSINRATGDIEIIPPENLTLTTRQREDIETAITERTSRLRTRN